MPRTSIKITGAAGQGIDSIGEIVGKGLKRAGYCVFGYREYMSLIKGGHSSYQLDVSDRVIRSSETSIDILVALNHHGLELNIPELKRGGIIIHLTEGWKFPPEIQKIIDKRKLSIVYLPVENILASLKAKPILGNVLLTSVLFGILGRDRAGLKELVTEQFGHKKDLLELNMRCIDEGYKSKEKFAPTLTIPLPEPNPVFRSHMLLTGSKAMGLGAIHAGVRLYAGYPMTPSSPLLTYIADMQNETGMVIKQAEDEITAAQIVSGAMYMGTRALTATSGGGFDLMSETLSLNGIIENPAVFVLAQRPGPATGLPTWTAQADLLMAINTAHGEFARCVLSVSDAQDCFDLMPIAFNLAEVYQAVVIVLTDKHVAEALFTQEPFSQGKATLKRGKLVTDRKELAKLKPGDRYDPKAKDGISLRWLPGAQAATYCAQGDEHNADGTVDETAFNAKAQLEKRMKKMKALAKVMPQPELWIGNREQGTGNRVTVRLSKQDVSLDVLLVGWGSTKGAVLDAMEEMGKGSEGSKGRKGREKRIGYLHFTYLWPLRTERFAALAKRAKEVVFVEGNYQGQLAMLLKQECGANTDAKILKYDGRPFFVDELSSDLQKYLNQKPGTKNQ
ncbi:MAG: 2-oxoacid:acceptor oxidoreductase subunit alpha [Candidatus Peregrinibacteria bacterium]|nr:2-oxoacid:acceptor oxidoreductase subunit alpha [Candidatus Peregrinibacteria bacterium]